MNKGDLIGRIAEKANLSKTTAADALNAALDCIETALREGDDVTLVGFGTFSIVDRKARIGRNPQTGAALQIPARRVTKFKPGAKLKTLNGGGGGNG